MLRRYIGVYELHALETISQPAPAATCPLSAVAYQVAEVTPERRLPTKPGFRLTFGTSLPIARTAG